MLILMIRYRSEVSLSAVNHLNIVCVKDGSEILNIVASHVEYETKGETIKPLYNWPDIEREVFHTYISSKPFISFSKDQLPSYVYQEDCNLLNQLQALDRTQV